MGSLGTVATMANRLADETSPYLRQHADNPVDWFPWSDEAWATARERDVPVLVSVGYSSCHWCHVMAHESFEDPAIGALVNDLFVSIKVDREERPDVDSVYMDAVQAMSGSGGWPMTVFCLPDGRPFFAGTYFPRQTRANMLGFGELCQRIDELWRTRRADLEEQAAKVTEAIASGEQLVPADEAPGAGALTDAANALLAQADRRDGGFGRAPKFPQSMSIDTQLRQHVRTGDTEALDVALLSLDAMASGGIYDHLGGGFARYSTDSRWLVPHFEKMLYDQALIARAYLHAWQVTGQAHHRQVLDETIAYVLRELRHPLGGFFSAEDADSEGVEGKFYVWSLDEVREVAGPDADAAVEWYGVTASGNWEGTNILERPTRGELLRPPEVERARAALFAARDHRIRPGLDDKVLTEWNALMLSTLAEAAAATGDPVWTDAAVTNAEFLCAELRRADGRWLRTWQGPVDGGREAGRAKILAYAADHAALVDAFVRMAELTGEARWQAEALTTAASLLELFWDERDGGFFTTGADAEVLVTRPKELMDNAVPSANSTAAVALLRLAALTGDASLAEPAEVVLRLLGEAAGRVPMAFGNVLHALELLVTGTTEVVVTGDRPDLLAEVRRHWLPTGVVAWGERTTSPLWEGRDEIGAAGRAYVCRGYVCDLPAADVATLATQLTP
jgi:uncharacterized protein YyaL (SSP411 family)